MRKAWVQGISQSCNEDNKFDCRRASTEEEEMAGGRRKGFGVRYLIEFLQPQFSPPPAWLIALGSTAH
jgi:hypothetical protein